MGSRCEMTYSPVSPAINSPAKLYELIIRLTPPQLYVVDPENVTNKIDLFQYASNLLYTNGLLIEEAGFLRALLERDDMGPTLLQEGMAIPHGQDACVSQPALLICQFHTPIPYKTPFSTSMVNKVFLFSLPLNLEKTPVEANYLRHFSTSLVNQNYTGGIHPDLHYREFCRHTSLSLATGIDQIFLN